ncbi:MAG: Gfo/Idh/MocA family oxidoreductase, partial [Pseudomonadota bacterium]|nr:Gfo/Idh/MocA family oxidoreductase [Pseudomonadota bacterium]
MPVQPDPIQPDVEFAFGEQPAFTRSKDEGQKIGVVGAGDVWIKFILPQLAQRGGDLYITDPKRPDITEKALKAGVPAEKIHVVSGIDAMPKDLNQIYLLTPPGSHAALLEKIAGTLPGVPVGIEKPLTGTKEDADRLVAFAGEHKVPVYGIDWALLNAQPLYHAFGMTVPYKDTLEVKGAENFAKFDRNDIVKIDARDIEGGGNSLADPAVLAASRPWMMDYRQAGGVAFDMTVHIVNVVEEMGFETKAIKQMFLGAVSDQQGIYNRFGSEDSNKGDMYARAHMT